MLDVVLYNIHNGNPFKNIQDFSGIRKKARKKE